MQYFTIQAKTHKEAIDKMRSQYGEGGKILTYRNIKLGGFLGFFSRQGIEITGYVSEEKKKINLEQEKKKILQSAQREQTLNYILKEIKSIKYNIDNTNSTIQKMHPNIEKIKKTLQENDFDNNFIDDLLTKIKSKFSLDDIENYNRIQDQVIEWIAENINIYVYDEEKHVKPRIFIIVGPTGVGKTTSIAKLAAIYGISNNGATKKNVRIITIDNYRIGAKKQIQIYGDIMRIPVSFAETEEDLKKLIAMYNDVDIILIDTIGKSQKDYKKLIEMKELINGCKNQAEVHLAVSATTKTKDIEEILQQFEPFNYKSIIVTKLDETSQIGNIISVVARKRKLISYITDGQKVPQDIEEASIMRFLMHLEGFRIRREYLEKKYGKYEKVIL